MNTNLIIGGTNTQVVAVGGGSLQSTALVEGQQYLLASTTNAWIAIGANPTAALHTTGSWYLPANVPVAVIIQGANLKVAVIQDSVAGFLSITQMSG